MEIRNLREEDIPALVDLVFAHRRSRAPNIPLSIKNDISEIFWSSLGAPFTYTFVATEYGAIYGFINIHVLDFPMIVGKECYVSDLLINENHRGKGAGSRLVEEAERLAREKNCKRMMLNNGKFTTAYQRDFYKQRGYKDRKNIANFVKEL